ncbi:MAG: RagB/SusD family nutrient uptake outer membrane protein, partial [Dysgonamonadaceae bacterium]|nr:RagB/SusD family nutrient uptake outer membrane protein [Dysgonamonadaceae bacterium]
MRNKKNFILLFCFFFALQSCESFLEETPYNKVTVGNFYTTKEGIEHGVNGAYSTLRGMYISEWMIYLCEGPSDLWVTWAAPLAFQNWTFDASTGEFYSMWSHSYSSINKINSVLEVLETTSIADLQQSLADRYIAELKFIRSLYYFHLVQQFGDVPLKLNPTKTAETTSYRDSKEEVWKQVISDLESCINSLPERYPDTEYGRVTKYAAMHLLSKTYLTVKRNQDDLNKALEYAEIIIQSGQYSLVGSHRDLWDINKKHNPEVIFPVLYTKNTELN